MDRLRAQGLEKHGAEETLIVFESPSTKAAAPAELKLAGATLKTREVNKIAAHYCRQAHEGDRLFKRLLNKQMLLLAPPSPPLFLMAATGFAAIARLADRTALCLTT